MNELIEQLCQKTGIDAATAQKVADFIRDNADKLPQWLSSDAAEAIKDKLPGGLGGLLGG